MQAGLGFKHPQLFARSVTFPPSIADSRTPCAFYACKSERAYYYLALDLVGQGHETSK